MPRARALFAIHGVTAELLSEDAESLARLRQDFSFFSTASDGKADVSLELREALPTGRPPGRSPWRWRTARISQSGALRTIDYEGRPRTSDMDGAARSITEDAGRALLEYDLEKERGMLHCPDRDLSHELAYLALHSRVGELLDRRGLHRVHALGFTYKGDGGLLLLPSGGGKSRLGLELLKRAGFGLLSDDIPLLDGTGRTLLAFPTGIGLRGEDRTGVPEKFLRSFPRRRFGLKWVVDLSFFADKVPGQAPLRWLLAGRRPLGARPALADCSRARAAAALSLNLVLGIGTPQVLELMAPAGPVGALRLAAIASARALCAARALARARLAHFILGDDPAQNADVLERFLLSSS